VSVERFISTKDIAEIRSQIVTNIKRINQVDDLHINYTFYLPYFFMPLHSTIEIRDLSEPENLGETQFS
jgi:hypothetical protein